MASPARPIVPAARFCGSLEALLAEPDIDCLLVASPNHCHVQQMQQIARTRPLLMEKPLYVNETEEAALARLRADYPAPIWVAMEFRYMPPITTFLQELDNATGGVRMLSIREHRFPFLPKVGDWNASTAIPAARWWRSAVISSTSCGPRWDSTPSA